MRHALNMSAEGAGLTRALKCRRRRVEKAGGGSAAGSSGAEARL